MPQWVKASERLPLKERDDFVVIANGEPCYADFRFHRCCMIGYPNGAMGKGFIDKENKLPIDVSEWLDESEPTFTLEQAKDIWEAAISWEMESRKVEGPFYNDTPNKKQYFKQQFNIDL